MCLMWSNLSELQNMNELQRHDTNGTAITRVMQTYTNETEISSVVSPLQWLRAGLMHKIWSIS